MWRKALTIPSAVLIDVPPVDTGRGLGAAASLVAFLGALAFLAADDGDLRFLGGILSCASNIFRPRWVGSDLDSLCSGLSLDYHTHLGLWVREEVRFFILWHFYGRNGAMGWRIARLWNFLVVAKNTFGGSSASQVPDGARHTIPTYIGYLGGNLI